MLKLLRNPLLLLLAVLTSCLPSSDKKKEVSDWQTVETKNFTLRLPSFMKEASTLNEEAILQYQNLIKEFYCIVIQESADVLNATITENGLEEDYTTDLNGYAKLIGDRFSENVNELMSKSDMKSISVNGKECRYFEANAKVSGIDIHYHYGFIKGDTTYYQVMSWTLLNKEDKFNDTMLEVLKSFKEK